MRVRYIDGSPIALVRGRVYDVVAIEGDWYRILDEMDDLFLYPPCAFEITDLDEDDDPAVVL